MPRYKLKKCTAYVWECFFIITKTNLANIHTGYVITLFLQHSQLFLTVKTLGQRWVEFGVKKYVMLCDFKLDTRAYSHK